MKQQVLLKKEISFENESLTSKRLQRVQSIGLGRHRSASIKVDKEYDDKYKIVDDQEGNFSDDKSRSFFRSFHKINNVGNNYSFVESNEDDDEFWVGLGLSEDSLEMTYNQG